MQSLEQDNEKMSETPNLKLPYIMASQAQKHITHNEAIKALDVVGQLGVITRALTAAPISPVDGDRFLVAIGAIGGWSGKDNQIAAWQDNMWEYYSPVEGWLCWVMDEDILLVFDGSAWVENSATGTSVNPTALVGVNTSADTTNRLAVSSANSLFTHDGSDHRIKINKAASVNTAAFLFQDNWSGRAEIGLSGDDNFHFKVSADGTNWYESILIDKDNGQVSFPAGISNPVLAGLPLGGLNQSDVLFIDPVAGNDTNDGKTFSTALKTIAALENKLPIGRALTLYVMNDLIWDYALVTRYPLHSLQIFGYAADGSGYAQRKITVRNATNYPSTPGCIMFFSPSVVYMSGINIDLDTDRNYAFMLFNNTMAYFRTADMTLKRVGIGSCVLFADGASFVPSQHSNFVIDVSASGYVARNVAAGTNPNNQWLYPSNMTSF